MITPATRRRLTAGCVLAPLALGAAIAATVATVSQRGRAFSVAAIHVHRGDSIHFTNDDTFDHHIYVESPGFKFSSPEQEPGAATDVPFPVSGTFDVQCEIHPRMHLAVTVD